MTPEQVREVQRLAEVARSASNSKDYVGELQAGQAMIATCEDHPGGWFHSGRALRALGRLDEAETILAPAIEKFPNDESLISLWVSLPRAKRDLAEAMRRAEWFRDHFPNSAGAHAHIVRTLIFSHRPHEAKTAAEAALLL